MAASREESKTETKELTESKIEKRIVPISGKTIIEIDDDIVRKSMGMAIKTLFHKYANEFKLTESEEKTGITQEKKNDTIFNNILNHLKEKSSTIKDIKLSWMLNFLVQKAEESAMPTEVDYVSLFVSESPPREEKHTVFLKKTLALVWKSLNDDACYSKSGLSHDKILKNRELRLTNFYNMLIKIMQAHDSSHKKFNNIIFSLNKPDELIAIESASPIIQGRIKAQIKEFWKRYENVSISLADKKIMTSALLNWMISGNVAEILKATEKSVTALEELKRFFMQHGSAPLETEKLFNKILATTAFFIDDNPVHTPWQILFKLLNVEETIKGHDARNTGILRIKRWILENYDKDNPEHREKISQFYEVEKIYQALITYDLPIPPEKKEEYDFILKTSTDYFLSHSFLPVKPGFIAQAHAFQTSLDHIKEKICYPTIKDFFIEWYQAKNHDTQKILYGKLLNNLPSVILNDEIIRALLPHPIGDYSDLSPYKINRIFLHAILCPPNEWTPLFSEVVQKTFHFVEKETNKAETLFRRAIYTDSLLKQLQYLIQVNQHPTSTPRRPPTAMILFPETAQTAIEYKQVFSLLPSDKCELIYRAYADKINRAIFLALEETDFTKKISLDTALQIIIPKSDFYVIAFFKALDSAKKVSVCFQYKDAFVNILKKIPAESKSVLLGFLDSATLQNSINDENDITYILENLPKKSDQVLFLEKLGSASLRAIISFPKGHKFFYNNPYYQDPGIQIILLNLLGGDYFRESIKTIKDLLQLFPTILPGNYNFLANLIGPDHLHKVLYSPFPLPMERKDVDPLLDAIMKTATMRSLVETPEQLSRRISHLVRSKAHRLNEKQISQLKNKIKSSKPATRLGAITLIHVFLYLQESETDSVTKAKSIKEAELLLEYVLQAKPIPEKEAWVKIVAAAFPELYATRSSESPLLNMIYDKLSVFTKKQNVLRPLPAAAAARPGSAAARPSSTIARPGRYP